MSKWLKRARGAIGMGLTWAAAWAVGGVLIGVTSNLLPGLPWNSFFEVFDAPLPALAIPGFFGGILFSIVLGVAARGRKFHELSLPRFAAWGALGGLLLTLLPFALFSLGLISREGSSHSALQITAAIAGPFILLSAISAAGSLLLARLVERRESLEGNANGAEPRLAGFQTVELGSGAVGASFDPQSQAQFEKRSSEHSNSVRQ